ncbi:hypothetical protein HAX54_017309 [Datura stramonium]|uniref:Uncharacterized protein n=1 Tax=Datura stramonium TaxID=4076 RepID=A0ABS8UMR5_DATST|nr:hypothetical protein [Datura stramonium]
MLNCVSPVPTSFHQNLAGANLLNVDSRGMQIILTPAAVNEVLGLPNPPEDELKARDVDGNEQWLVDDML